MTSGVLVPDLDRTVRQRIRWAKAILGPNCDKVEVEKAVMSVVVRQVRINRPADFDYGIVLRIRNKNQKMATDRVARELRRLNAALRHKDLPKYIKRLFQVEELSKLQSRLEILARRPLGKPRKRADASKRNAAMEAAFLLHEHRLPLTTTRRGKFHQLAAVLYGAKDADLFDYCRQYRNVNFEAVESD
jgi:hypothetical protein